MRLDRLELRNICQHEHLSWEFQRGLIGIYGPNGSGKSNALNLGCYAGITNDYSRHEQGKPGYVRQQVSSREKAEIRVLFTHDGEQIEIVRGLQAPTKHEMRFITAGGQPLTKATEIQAELEDVLGIKRRLIDDFVFVGQNDLFSFLSTVPSERAKSFAHLCNTVKAEQIWELLKEQITVDSSLVVDVTGDLDEIRKQIGEYKTRKAETEKQLAEAKKDLLTKATKEWAEALINRKRDFDRVQSEVEALQKDVARKKGVASAARVQQLEADSEFADAKAKAKGDDEQMEGIVAAIATVDEAVSAYGRRVTAEVRRDELQKSLDELVGEEPENPEHSIAQKDRELQILQTEVSRDEEFSSSFEEGVAKCPTCGTRTDSPELQARLTKARKGITGLRKQVVSLRKEIKEQQQYERERQKYQADLDLHNDRIENNKQTLEEIGDVREVDADTLSDLEGSREGIIERRHVVIACQNECNSRTTFYETKKAEYHTLHKQLAVKQTEQTRLDVVDDEVAAARESLTKHQNANGQVKGYKATIRELDGFIKRRESDIKRIIRIQAQSKRARVWLDTLTDLRDEVMHRDKLPKIVHRNYLLDMEEEINEALEVFDSPFGVRATEDVGFTAHFPNGTIMPAAGLSGGQKVILAIAYRLTVNSLFASQVGMMVLDEPTDGLDQENRELAAQVFVKLGEVARSRGHQVIVITHDDSLQNVFDQKFVLERAA